MKWKIFNTVFYSIVVIESALLITTITYGQERKNDNIADLSKRIGLLETLVESQQNKIESLEKEIERLKKNSPLVTIPSVPNFKEMPEGAKPFEFNGRTYYMVPLNNLTNDRHPGLKNK